MIKDLYRIEQSDDDQNEGTNKFYDKNGNFEWKGESSGSSEKSEDSDQESSLNSEIGDEEQVWDSEGGIPY